MDEPLYFFAGHALDALLAANLSGRLSVERDLDLERAAWRIAQNMVATKPEAA
jgi:hypothetical protein